MNEFKVPEGWEVGHKDGYYTKTIKVGNCTCIIHRPFLTDEDEKSGKRRCAVPWLHLRENELWH